MNIKTILYADDGKILTNGEIYGKRIFLADTDKAENYHEITEAEYNAFVEQIKAEEKQP